MLEEEIYGENSPIWDAEFTMPANEGAQLGPQTGLCTSGDIVCVYSRAVKFLKFNSLKSFFFFILLFLKILFPQTVKY